MTCIVASVQHRIIVSDTRCSDDNSMVRVSKIRRIKGGLVGCAGGWSEILYFWDKIGGKRVKDGVLHDQADFCGIELARDGLYLYDPAGRRYSIKDEFYAIGSGGPYALGAMAMGATPEEAVAIASRFDPGTGSEIEVLQLKVARNGSSGSKR